MGIQNYTMTINRSKSFNSNVTIYLVWGNDYVKNRIKLIQTYYTIQFI